MHTYSQPTLIFTFRMSKWKHHLGVLIYICFHQKNFDRNEYAWKICQQSGLLASSALIVQPLFLSNMTCDCDLKMRKVTLHAENARKSFSFFFDELYCFYCPIRTIVEPDFSKWKYPHLNVEKNNNNNNKFEIVIQCIPFPFSPQWKKRIEFAAK